MRNSILILLGVLASGCTSAHKVNLVAGQGYVVPANKVWVIKNAPVAPCRVCTADIYIKGEVSNVEVEGVIFHGEFDFSIGNAAHKNIKIYSGTQVWLGDTRGELVVNEEPM